LIFSLFLKQIRLCVWVGF